ncbi:uncharacterized protein LOC126378290 [Pectinophora gossypiella]|uniref:uncharacterized protein LOC126378290 n=1 Tax=Pectinophora gossypiella TaxID=13191 RepID=UPI00214EDA72|nr:uncharacterized protein LOC126378290 [Pectinophora gossypiella]
MDSIFEFLLFCFLCFSFGASYHEQYRVPHACTDKWESYIMDDKEYLLQNLPVTWENAKILCRGHHNGTLAILDTKEKAEFLAEALSESQLMIESLWVGARREGSEDPLGYRWDAGQELRRTALDVLSEEDSDFAKHYPLWLNRTHIPVPEGGADCVALERVAHDKPVFVDLPCQLQRAFACERDAQKETVVSELKKVRCRSGLYHVYDGSMDWHQAAAYCVINKMSLANIASMRCLKKLGVSMLKTRPSIENAWVGARGSLGRWWWVDTGLSIFQTSPYSDAAPGTWPPLRDRVNLKPNGCLQLDRHATHPPVFLEARCERKMQFICYQSTPLLRSSTALPSDENYYYVLVRQALPWQNAYDNCINMKGTLASMDTSDMFIQLLLIMGENKDEPVDHIWVSGRLNNTDSSVLAWYNPTNNKKIQDAKAIGDANSATFVPPWLDEEFTMDSPCLNLDRQDHLKGLVYGLPCDVLQYSICIIGPSPRKLSSQATPMSPTSP